MNYIFIAKKKLIRVIYLITILLSSCSQSGSEKELRELIAQTETKVKPLIININRAEFEANVSGKDEDFQKAAELNIKLTRVYSNKDIFEKFKKFKETVTIEDPLLKNELDAYYGEYKFHQVDEKKMAQMIRFAKEIEKKFAIYRGEIGSEKLSDSEIENILSYSTDSKKLEDAWKASKQVGELIASDMIGLVKMRNEAAKGVGFANYHEMSLKLSGQDPKQIDDIFLEVDLLTQQPYNQLKSEIDDYLSQLYKVPVDQLYPWHYQNRYFQQAPAIYKVELDQYFKGKNVTDIGEKFFAGIGLDVKDIIQVSDLEEKPGKRQLSECKDIDREGDIRVLASFKDDEYSMNTMLYEFGWAAYCKNIDRNLPFSLRTPAHFLTVDGIATLFSNFASDAQWIYQMVGISKEEYDKINDGCKKRHRLERFVFCRWALVMYYFEKNMYENPDQDLNKLWWNLVEKYQKLKRPPDRNKPDWAAKAHIITLPCTYHNYLLGELFSAQLITYINEKVVQKDANGQPQIVNNPAVGDFLKEKIFRFGAQYNWNELIKNATGEELTAHYYKSLIIR
jgi:peptidyl-dipeptidase A